MIDEVVLNNDLFLIYKNELKNHSTCFVCVLCDLTELQKREISRGDRHIGLSKGQFSNIHINKTYDLIVDTTSLAVEEVAKKILTRNFAS